jgi:hypothetical protein
MLFNEFRVVFLQVYLMNLLTDRIDLKKNSRINQNCKNFVKENSEFVARFSEQPPFKF